MKPYIFADRYTTKKVVIMITEHLIEHTLQILNEKFGGNWVYVDSLAMTEGLMFNDNTVYIGYSPDIKRYSDLIVKIL